MADDKPNVVYPEGQSGGLSLYKNWPTGYPKYGQIKKGPFNGHVSSGGLFNAKPPKTPVQNVNATSQDELSQSTY